MSVSIDISCMGLDLLIRLPHSGHTRCLEEPGVCAAAIGWPSSNCD